MRAANLWNAEWERILTAEFVTWLLDPENVLKVKGNDAAHVMKHVEIVSSLRFSQTRVPQADRAFASVTQAGDLLASNTFR